MALISELKKEHSKLLDVFDKIEQTQLTDKNLIKTLKKLAVNHLEKENKQLYPKLLKSKQVDVRETTETFSDMMGEYSKQFILIIDKLLKSNSKISSKLIKDFEQISDKIKDRIVLEESVLFELYKKCI